MVDLLKRTRIYNLLFGISLFILTIFTIYFPLTNEINKTLLENWIATATSSSLTFKVFTEKSIEGAHGVSSRSVIRDAIIQYNSGQLGWEELAEFTDPKYKDGVSVIDNIVLAYRLVHDDVLVFYEPEPDHNTATDFTSIPKRDGQIDIFYSHGKYHLVVYSDIEHDRTLLGTDVLVYDMTPILEEIHTSMLQVEIIDLDTRMHTDFGSVYSSSYSYQVSRDKEMVHYLQEIDPGRYYLHIYTPYKQIIGVSQSRIYLQLALFTLGVLLLFILFNMVILRQANRLLTESESSREKYRKFAYQDTLTNAYSRLSLDHWLEEQKNSTTPAGLSMVMLDIDSFKYINDEYGHQVGDEVLIRLADTINATIRKDDFLVRYGGDEFVIIFNHAQEEQAAEVLKRIEARLEKENPYEFPIRISYGIAQIDNINEYDEALVLADQRMYIHKNSKNNKSKN